MFKIWLQKDQLMITGAGSNGTDNIQIKAGETSSDTFDLGINDVVPITGAKKKNGTDSTVDITWESENCTTCGGNGTPVDKYKVTFDSNGGTEVPAQYVAPGGTATKPTNPTKEGKTFKGWYLNGTSTKYAFATQVNSNITLVAKWG